MTCADHHDVTRRLLKVALNTNITIQIQIAYCLSAGWRHFNSNVTLLGGRTYLVGEGFILVGDQQDGGKKRQISTPVSIFSAIVGVSWVITSGIIPHTTLLLYTKRRSQRVNQLKNQIPVYFKTISCIMYSCGLLEVFHWNVCLNTIAYRQLDYQLWQCVFVLGHRFALKKNLLT
jgi:hypothetical protein